MPQTNFLFDGNNTRDGAASEGATDNDRRQRAANSDDPVTLLREALGAVRQKYSGGLAAEAERELTELLHANLPLCERNDDAFNSFVHALLVVRRFDLVATMVRDKFGYAGHLEITSTADEQPDNQVKWEITPAHEHRFIFSDAAFEKEKSWVTTLFFLWTMPLCSHYSRCEIQEHGAVIINLGDFGDAPGLAFCDNRPDRFLVPDTVFLPNRGYAYAREVYDASYRAWSGRLPVALWRGATTGIADAGAWRSLPRVRLCELARASGGLIDAGLTDIVQIHAPEIIQEIEQSGLLGVHIPWQDWGRYKYQIDIDGNSNAWSGLFFRLLTGSPVLKVESSRGFVQWYYNRLIPWENYVPVASDMSDLIDKLNWLMHHEAIAENIGSRGRDLAQSLTYEREVARAGLVVSAALRHFRGEPGDAGPYGWIR